MPALPAPPSQAELESTAVTSIAASWRRFRQRRSYVEQRRRHRAARRIQSAWSAGQIRSATRLELMRREEEERKLQTMMLYQLGQDWFQARCTTITTLIGLCKAKAMRRVEVHVSPAPFLLAYGSECLPGLFLEPPRTAAQDHGWLPGVPHTAHNTLTEARKPSLPI